MSRNPAPTVVVGVGGAGTEIITALAARDGLGWGTAYDDYFELVAIDSDPADLESVPDDVTTVALETLAEEFDTARRSAPYLTASHQAGQQGSDRQRAVGRYLFDSKTTNSDGLNAKKLGGILESHLETFGKTDRSLHQLNVVHVHSLGGGTGSGTFPLVAYALDELTDNLRRRTDVQTYTAGIGIVPEILHDIGQGFDAVAPPGDCRYYANAYAALRDLEKLVSLDPSRSLPIYRYSEERDHETNSPFAVDRVEPHGQITGSPYRHFFLVGVDEGRMDGEHRTRGPEDYRTAIDNTVIAAIYGLSMLGGSVRSWLTPPVESAHFGMFGQSQLSIPIQHVRTYCDLTDRIARLRGEADESREELEAAITEREELIETLTTGEYGARLGYLSLDEEMVREKLNKRTLETDLTSLAAFHEQGYLARDLQGVMESRIRQAYAWYSPVYTWSSRGDFGTIAHRTRSVRDIWMLHSEENDTLPSIEITGVGRHRFHRSGECGLFPSFQDPYTVQFVTYMLDAPLSALRVYSELDEAATDGRLDTVLDEWDDYRLAFAYPEWYGRNVRQYFDILTSVTLPKLPELNVGTVSIEKEGTDLITWLSSHGLASYLWLADEWPRYDGFLIRYGTDRVGWKTVLRDYGLEYHDMREIVPNGKPVEQWYAGTLTWDELLAEVEHRLTTLRGIQVEFTNT